MEKLIKKGITHLLDRIQHGTHRSITPSDLAEEQQLTDEDIFDFIREYYQEELNDLGVDGEDNIAEDEFIAYIKEIQNTEWYDEQYIEHMERATQGFNDEESWHSTELTLMPNWKPSQTR